jgi:hypothetical protein
MAVDHLGAVHGRAEWLLTRSGPGTRFVWREDVHLRPEPVGDVALALYWPLQRWLFRRSMRNVRRLAEASR